jgi:hypothetical protein
LFERAPAAREALDDLREHGVEPRRVGMLVPDVARSSETHAPSTHATGLLAGTSCGGDISSVLQDMGVPDGEARFYAHEVAEGHRTLVIVNADGDYARARSVLLQHGGYDVQSRGGDLAAADNAGVRGRSIPKPVDITGRWEDVASRYEMLWQQHYGTSDATWQQLEPIYRFAWELANSARWRGKPWSEAEADVRRAWSSHSSVPWKEVAGPVHDVWEDVAEEASMGAEGGRARRIPPRGK